MAGFFYRDSPACAAFGGAFRGDHGEFPQPVNLSPTVAGLQPDLEPAKTGFFPFLGACYWRRLNLFLMADVPRT